MSSMYRSPAPSLSLHSSFNASNAVAISRRLASDTSDLYLNETMCVMSMAGYGESFKESKRVAARDRSSSPGASAQEDPDYFTHCL